MASSLCMVSCRELPRIAESCRELPSADNWLNDRPEAPSMAAQVRADTLTMARRAPLLGVAFQPISVGASRRLALTS